MSILYILGAISLSCILIVILYGILFLLDKMSLKELIGYGVVVDKWLESSHEEMSFIMCGDAMIPITKKIPDTLHIKIKIDNLIDIISISNNIDVDINSQVKCVYSIGRLSKSLQIKRLI